MASVNQIIEQAESNMGGRWGTILLPGELRRVVAAFKQMRELLTIIAEDGVANVGPAREILAKLDAEE